jgi:hypothetical protein
MIEAKLSEVVKRSPKLDSELIGGFLSSSCFPDSFDCRVIHRRNISSSPIATTAGALIGLSPNAVWD